MQLALYVVRFNSRQAFQSVPNVSARALQLQAIRRGARLANLLNFALARGVKLSRALAKLAGEAKCIFSPQVHLMNAGHAYRFTEIETHAISPSGDFNRFAGRF